MRDASYRRKQRIKNKKRFNEMIPYCGRYIYRTCYGGYKQAGKGTSYKYWKRYSNKQVRKHTDLQQRSEYKKAWDLAFNYLW